jgi:hypothetical protein
VLWGQPMTIVLKFVVSIGFGIAVYIAWIALWVLALRAFGIPVFKRTPEETGTRTRRILQMGKLRYILIFGVLGNGFAFGLGIGVATMTAHHSANWGRAAAIFGAVSLLGGCFHGVRTWNHLFHTEVSFPPL